ncbi:hypothetical protein [Paenirhodobacter sp. CAU 1674]|uniref:hypothetical protein n=1 Tax=Paenirhodobacter sp. CAU 1674 TaxID=3032596 RepID=UPI0023DB35D5|nr:hypothetical protein [Paenirhodobacter sp. CAU 1674]MDF2142051.1 hypothetical protein [Paenirhodobacter sp. CAU 1674]
MGVVGTVESGPSSSSVDAISASASRNQLEHQGVSGAFAPLTENMPSEAGLAFLSRLTQNAKAREHFLSPLGAEVAVDLTDGLRISLEMGRTLHLRPSGNAPEFRVYVEATNEAEAQNLLNRALKMVKIGLANN